MPVEASPRNSCAKVSVSAADRPEDGSSSSSTRGWVASARATSTSRAVPVGSSSARVSATSCRPRCSMIVSVMTSGLPAPVRAHRLRCRSAATRMLSRTDSEPNTSRRWKVRARPSRANWCGRAPVTSLPSTTIRPALGSCMPVATLNSVVLPAPFGPMRPMICPSCRSRLTLLTASRPPKRTLTSRSSTAGRSVLTRAAGEGSRVCSRTADRPVASAAGSAAGVPRVGPSHLRSLAMFWTSCSQRPSGLRPTPMPIRPGPRLANQVRKVLSGNAWFSQENWTRKIAPTTAPPTTDTPPTTSKSRYGRPAMSWKSVVPTEV